MENEPLPPACDSLLHNYGLFYLVIILFFVFIALLALKKGKTREAAFHCLMVTVILEIFILMYFLIVFTLPMIAIKMKHGA